MLSSALAFASIVQLLAIHKQETKSSDIGEFRAWLGAHNFPELRTLLEDNRESTRRVKEYLGDTDGRFTGKLDEIRGVVDGLVAVLTGADASAVEASGLSAQAINILEQMVQVDAEEIGLIKSMRHVELEVFEGASSGTQLSVLDWKSLEDDLQALVTQGYLRHRVGDRGDGFYGITRQANELVRRRRACV